MKIDTRLLPIMIHMATNSCKTAMTDSCSETCSEYSDLCLVPISWLDLILSSTGIVLCEVDLKHYLKLGNPGLHSSNIAGSLIYDEELGKEVNGLIIQLFHNIVNSRTVKGSIHACIQLSSPSLTKIPFAVCPQHQVLGRHWTVWGLSRRYI